MEEKKEACWKAGVLVRIVRLTNASHHNGKIGRVSARAGPNGRIGNAKNHVKVLNFGVS